MDCISFENNSVFYIFIFITVVEFEVYITSSINSCRNIVIKPMGHEEKCFIVYL